MTDKCDKKFVLGHKIAVCKSRTGVQDLEYEMYNTVLYVHYGLEIHSLAYTDAYEMSTCTKVIAWFLDWNELDKWQAE